MTDPTIIHTISNIIALAAKFRNSYFFSSPGSASARRSYERNNSIDTITWTENGHTYTAAFTVSCSCSNVYASGTYTRDGKKTTLTAIKNSYARLTA